MDIDLDVVMRLRRMVAEPTEDNYTDPALWARIEEVALRDSQGKEPGEDGWEPRYNLHKAAADIWFEKAGAMAGDHDFSADGGKFSRSQKYQHAVDQAMRHQSRAKGQTIKFAQSPLSRLNSLGWEDLPYKDD